MNEINWLFFTALDGLAILALLISIGNSVTLYRRRKENETKLPYKIEPSHPHYRGNIRVDRDADLTRSREASKRDRIQK